MKLKLSEHFQNEIEREAQRIQNLGHFDSVGCVEILFQCETGDNTIYVPEP